METDLITDVWEDRGQGFRLDLSRMGIPSAFRTAMQEPLQRALAAMRELERGAVANPDEGRMVGHYWLRAPELAPSMAIAATMESRELMRRTYGAEARRREWPSVGLRAERDEGTTGGELVY